MISVSGNKICFLSIEENNANKTTEKVAEKVKEGSSKSASSSGLSSGRQSQKSSDNSLGNDFKRNFQWEYKWDGGNNPFQNKNNAKMIIFGFVTMGMFYLYLQHVSNLATEITWREFITKYLNYVMVL